MIQEPISDLQKILGEPVDEVTGEYRAIPDRTGQFYRDDQQEHIGRAPCLRPRLTVRLVALKSEQVITPFTPKPEGETGLAPVRMVPLAFSGPLTPEPDANILTTPAPEGNDYGEDYAEDDDADAGEFYPYLDTPTPEPDANRGPYTPTPENNSWLYRESPKLRTGRLSGADRVQPIILSMKPEVVESVSAGLTPAPTHAAKRHLRFDPALTMLTFLLLLGILGGIGFGYLLTIVYQG
jgi:hypothetical protein